MSPPRNVPTPDQSDFFSKTPRVKPAPSNGLARGTADRGTDAPDPRTARDAVSQEAMHMGSADPDNEHVRRRRSLSRRAREEHAAEGSGHASMFEYTPGSQTVAPKALDPFRAFDDAWYRMRSKAEESFSGITTGTIQLFAQARSVTVTPKGEPGAESVQVAVTLAGFRFEADGETTLDAMNRLAATARRGPEAATAEDHAPRKRAPSSLELAWAKLSPEERTENEVWAHMIQRKTLFTKQRDRGQPFALSPMDFELAAKVGVTIASAATEPEIVAFFQAVDRMTRQTELEHWEAMGRYAELPGEAHEKFNARVGSLEGLRNDRYIDDSRNRATAGHQAAMKTANDEAPLNAPMRSD
jgi:hypothetical protein